MLIEQFKLIVMGILFVRLFPQYFQKFHSLLLHNIHASIGNQMIIILDASRKIIENLRSQHSAKLKKDIKKNIKKTLKKTIKKTVKNRLEICNVQPS